MSFHKCYGFRVSGSVVPLLSALVCSSILISKFVVLVFRSLSNLLAYVFFCLVAFSVFTFKSSFCSVCLSQGCFLSFANRCCFIGVTEV